MEKSLVTFSFDTLSKIARKTRFCRTVDGKSGGFFDFYCIPIADLRVDDEVCHSCQISDFVKGRGWGKAADKNRLRFQKICCRCASAFSY